jgi:mannonate dehydratase
MKLGLGLYRQMLTREDFQFARQAGATYIIVHLVDYFHGGSHGSADNQPTGTQQGWELAGDSDRLWSTDELAALRREVNAAGLLADHRTGMNDLTKGPRAQRIHRTCDRH